MKYVPEPTPSQIGYNLEWMNEYSINGLIYAVDVYAREAEDIHPADNSDHRYLFVWSCVDSDGDGKFELLPKEKRRSVPLWATRGKDTAEPRTK